MIRMPQGQWNLVLDYAFGLALALGYGAVSWLFDLPWWLISFIICVSITNWHRRADIQRFKEVAKNRMEIQC